MTTRKSRRGAVTTGAAIVSAITGIVLILVACAAQQTPPKPSAAAAHPSPTAASSTPPGMESKPPASPEFVPPSQGTTGPVLTRAVPISIDIPVIGVHSALMSLGQNPDGSIQVPPLSTNSVAGWYNRSPTPGQVGPSVILGHIDSKAYGPAVFFKLGALKPGNTVTVHRADHTIAVFRVDKVAEYAKTTFPTHQVYGNIDHAGLRLITCGGTFNPTAHSYDDNIIAYASLVSSSHTT